MISRYMFEKVRQLISEGKNNSEIAKSLGINRKTVRKYRQTNSPPKYHLKCRREKKDHFEQYRERAKTLLALHQPDQLSQTRKKSEGRITVSDIFEVLRAEGYKGSERTLSRRIRELRSEKGQERFYEQVYQPGEQCQFDFKESIEIPFKSGPRKLNLFFATLPYSDRFFIKAFTFKNYEAFADGMHSFFTAIGGMTESIRIDNLSPCVKKVLKGDARVYTESFLRAIDYYGFKVLPCNPGKGSDKGDCERDIRTHARKIKSLIKIQNLSFEDLEDFNNWVMEFVATRQNAQSIEKFKDETSKLRPTSAFEESIVNQVQSARVTSYGTVHVAHATYSVPDEAIGHIVKVVISAERVRIYKILEGTKKLVANHPRQKKGGHAVQPEHVITSLVRKPRALIRWKYRDIFLSDPNFNRLYHKFKGWDESRAEREFLKTMNLIQYTTLAEISIATSLLIDQPADRLYEEIKNLVLLDSFPGHSSGSIIQAPIQTDLNQYDLLIPNGGN